MACKSDAIKEVDPYTAATMLRDHKVGLVEVSTHDDSGKDRMRRSFDWMIRAIYCDRCEYSLLCTSYVWPLMPNPASTRTDSNSVYRNPASPDVLNAGSHPWDLSRPLLNSPPADGPPLSISTKSRTSYFSNPPSTPRTPPKSPTRTRSHNDLLFLAREREERETGNQVSINDFNSRSSLPATSTNVDITNRSVDNLEAQPAPKRQDQLSFFRKPWTPLMPLHADSRLEML